MFLLVVVPIITISYLSLIDSINCFQKPLIALLISPSIIKILFI